MLPLSFCFQLKGKDFPILIIVCIMIEAMVMCDFVTVPMAHVISHEQVLACCSTSPIQSWWRGFYEIEKLTENLISKREHSVSLESH